MILRRKRNKAEESADSAGTESTTPEPVKPSGVRANGPWDQSEVKIDPEDGSYVDLGGLVVKGRAGFDLQIPTDDQGTPTAVLFVAPEAALELRAFAASRSGGVWDEVRADILSEAERLKAKAQEVDGPFGKEVRIQMPAKTPDGKDAIQPSRIVAVEGPRWLLRGTFLGRAALEPDEDGVLESAFRDVVVVRGSGPMAPREILPLTLPANAVVADRDDS